MWPFDRILLAQRDAARAMQDTLSARLTDADLVIRQQADLIRQLRESLPNYEPRRCYCPETRWELWREGLIAGPDGVVGSADDNLNPEPP